MRILKCFAALFVVTNAFALQTQRVVPEDNRPPLFLREDWKDVTTRSGGVPITQAVIATPDIELKVYGVPATSIDPDIGIFTNRRESPKDDPTYAWSGPCRTPCALALRNKNSYVDLTGLAKVRWRTKQTGYHYLRPIIKLADGTWLVGDHAEPARTDWLVTEFSFIDVRWHYFSPDKVVTTRSADWVLNPDLRRVDEVGFTDLLPGAAADEGHGSSGAFRVDWIEIYGAPVPRE